MKLTKLNQKGIAHILAPVLFIAIFGAIGGYVLLKSQAASVPDSISSDQSSTLDSASGVGIPRGTFLKSTQLEQTSALASSTQPEQTSAPAISERSSPVCYEGGACYYYVTAVQEHINAAGASAYFSQAKPILARGEYHTLIEMDISDVAHGNDNEIEFGWVVEPDEFKDRQPHLFLDHTVNGNDKVCAKGCGFVRNPKARVHIGDVVKKGVKAKYEVKFAHNQWRVFYNNKLLGYLPASYWHGKFKKFHQVQLYGEVAVPHGHYKPHSQMGNGRYGTSKGSASISHYSLFNSNKPPRLRQIWGDSYRRAYNHGKLTHTSMQLGGPGV